MTSYSVLSNLVVVVVVVVVVVFPGVSKGSPLGVSSEGASQHQCVQGSFSVIMGRCGRFVFRVILMN